MKMRPLPFVIGFIVAALAARSVPAAAPEPAQSPSRGWGGVPAVLLHSGEVNFQATDLTLPGRGDWGLTLERTYRNRAVGAGPLGPGWEHGYQVRLRALPDGQVELRDGRLRRAVFTPEGVTTEGRYRSPPGWFVALTRVADGWVLLGRGRDLQRFDRFGRLISWADAVKDSAETGNLLTFRYQSERLAEARDDAGRWLRFVYDTTRDWSPLVAVEDSTGRRVAYEYDAAGRLVAVTRTPVTGFPAGLTTRYSYAAATGDLASRLASGDNLVAVTDPAGLVRWQASYEDGNGDGRPEELASLTTPAGTWQLRYAGRVTTVVDRRGQSWVAEHDDAGHPVRQVDPTGAAWTFVYNADGSPTESRSPLGRVTRWAYAPSESPRGRGNVVAQREEPDSRGGVAREWAFQYEPKWNSVVRVVDPRGAVTTIERGAGGLPVTLTRAAGAPDAAVDRFEYDAFGQPTRQVDPTGRLTSFAYDASGLLRQMVVDPAGLQLTTRFEVNDRGFVTAVVDPRGVRHTTDFNEWGWPLATTIAAGASIDGAPALFLTTQYHHDALGRVVRVDEPFGDLGAGTQVAQRFTYGPEGELLVVERELAPGGEVTRSTFTYDAGLNLQQTTDAEGRVTTWRYDPRGLLLSITEGVGTAEAAESRVVYDAEGAEVARLDPLGRSTLIESDGFGRPVVIVEPTGTRFEQVYDAGDLPVERRALAGATVLARTTHSYDALGRPTEQARWLADRPVATRFTYDRAGRLVTTVDPLGRSTSVEYDAAGRPITLVDAAGHRLEHQLDRAGNPVTTTLHEAPGTSFSTTTRFDALGRAVERADALGNRYLHVFDAGGYPRLTIDPVGAVTERTFDGLGRLTSLTGPEGRRIETRFDKSSRLASYRDARGLETTWSYDALGRATEQTFADGTSVTASYDPAGNVIRTTDPRGIVISQQFDAGDRLVSRTVTPPEGLDLPGPRTESYQWDGLGRLVRAESGGVVTERGYDALSRLLSETTDGRTVEFQRDDAGNPTAVTLPSGQTLGQTFDGLDRLTGVTGIASFSYRGPDLLAEQQLGDLTTRFAYDAARRGIGQEVLSRQGTLFRETQRRDPRGLTTALQQGDFDGHLFTHDGAGRLTNAARSVDALALAPPNGVVPAAAVAGLPGRETFLYDAADNLSSRQVRGDLTAQVETFGIDPGRNRPAASPRGALLWDAAGNLTARGEQRFSYDAWNRLTEVLDAAGPLIATYHYDAFGRRVRKTVGGVNETTTWQGWQPVEVQRDGQLAERRTYGAALDGLVQLERDLDGDGTLDHTYRPVFDGTGRLVLLTDANGQPIEQYETSAYGQQTVRVDDTPPAVEQLSQVGGELRLELSEPVLPSELAAGGVTLTATQEGVSTPLELTITQPLRSGRQAHRRVVVRPTEALVPGTALTLTLPPRALTDALRNRPGAAFSHAFTWSAQDVVLLDESAPRIEWVALRQGVLEIELSEPPNLTAAATALVLDGQTTSWTLAPHGYRLTTPAPLLAGAHTLELTSAPLDLSGKPAAAPQSWAFTVIGSTPDLLVFQAPDPRLVAASSVGNTLTFQGLPRDPETGLLYARHRYYDPELGRFLTADPSGFADGPSDYAFARNQPVDFSDPMGLEAAVSRRGHFVITDPTTGLSRVITQESAAQDPRAVWRALLHEGRIDLRDAVRLMVQGGLGSTFEQDPAFALAVGVTIHVRQTRDFVRKAYFVAGTSIAVATLAAPAAAAVGLEGLAAATTIGGISGLGGQGASDLWEQQLSSPGTYARSAALGAFFGFVGRAATSAGADEVASIRLAGGGANGRRIALTPEGIAAIERHLARPELRALADPPNAAMVARLKAGKTSPQDLNFYKHELTEAEFMSRGLDARAAHLKTLEAQGIVYRPGYEAELYHPDVIRTFSEFFNPAAHPKP